MDTSLVYGKNKMEFTIENTLNRSLGPASPTQFDAGGFDYDELGVQLLRRASGWIVVWANSPLNVATGLEARRETYSIFAGEPNSYINGGVRLLANGTPTQSGAQVFPGFRPSNAVDEDRNAVGAYLDLEANVTQTVARARSRCAPSTTPTSAATCPARSPGATTSRRRVRAARLRAERLPRAVLQQQYFATTSTNFINGVPFDITTFPATDPVAQALGAKAARRREVRELLARRRLARRDHSASPSTAIASTSTIASCCRRTSRRTTCAPTCSRSDSSASAAAASSSTVSTRAPRAWMLVVEPAVPHGWRRPLRRHLHRQLQQDGRRQSVLQTQQLAALSPSPPLFDRINILSFEEGTPKTKFGAALNWSLARYSATLRATRYGEVLDPGTTARPRRDSSDPKR